MTRHNLDEHLSWLLHAKPSVPGQAALQPVRSLDAPSQESKTTGTRTLPGIRGGAPVTAVPNETEFHGALDSHAMVRVKSPPSSAKTYNPMFIDLSKFVSEKPQPKITPTSNALGSMIPQAQSKRRTPATLQRIAETARNVDFMDLTEITDDIGSPTIATSRGQRSSRKRKSSEFELDLHHTTSPQAVAPSPQSNENVPRISQNGFTILDEVMAEASDPPPPYSTIAPGLAANAARSPGLVTPPAGRACNIMLDSDYEENDDDVLVNFAGSMSPRHECCNTPPHKKQALSHIPDTPVADVGLNARGSPQKELIKERSPGKRVIARSQRDLPVQRPQLCQEDLPSEAQWKSTSAAQETVSSEKLLSASGSQPALTKSSGPTTAYEAQSGIDSELLKKVLAIPTGDVRQFLENLELKKDSLCNQIADLIDKEQDDETKELECVLDALDVRAQAIRDLFANRVNYERLSKEKDQLFVALKDAIKARQCSDAKAAYNVGKAKLTSFENECWKLLLACREDMERLLASSVQNAVAMQSMQFGVTSTPTESTHQPSLDNVIQSSSRVRQTQVLDAAPIRHTEQYLQGPICGDEIPKSTIRTPQNYNTMKPPYTNSTRAVHTMTIYDDNDDYEDLDDNDMLLVTESNTNISKKPLAPFLQDRNRNASDIGGAKGIPESDDDVENDIKNLRPVHHTPHRTAFKEISDNIRLGPLSRSPEATKKHFVVKHMENEGSLKDKYGHYQWFQDVALVLKQRFRLRGFRQHQLDAIAATLEGKDTFVLMPTGGGKSLCYQLPALVRSGKTQGVTVVVSPLLSLMEDQVQHLRRLNIQAFLINSETSMDERRSLLDGLREPDVENFVQLLYITPEMLSKSKAMLDALSELSRRRRLARLVIDEAHCVSQWGHDFRPDYKTIGDVRRRFPDTPVMALTATATENVKIDTIHNLSITGCQIFTSSFNRPNLFYSVRKKAGKEDMNSIAEIIMDKHAGQSGIIYCLSRKNCESMVDALKEYGIAACFYHAGVAAEVKRDVQKQWQAGKFQVVVATIAFGMGIDKPDVRFVIHHSMPKSLEGYYQETGRAGRDGKKSGCYLFHSYQDVIKLRRMIDDGDGSREQKERQRGMLDKMVQYCQNVADCRRTQVLSYFNEHFSPENCDKQCDNCNTTSTFKTFDMTRHAQQAVKLVSEIQDDNVTILNCMHLFRGVAGKKNKEKYEQLEEFGAGRDLDRGDIERLFNRLLSEGVFEEQHKVRCGFPQTYLKLGRKSNLYDARGMDQRSMIMQVKSTPRTKSHDTAEAKVSRSKGANSRATREKKKAGGSRVEAPLSTNVSSPLQSPSLRKKARSTSKNVTKQTYIAAQSEDDDSDGAFAPVRVGGQLKSKARRALGPPITRDSVLEGLDPLHREIIDEFTKEAKKKANEIMLSKSLRQPPFSDTILRHMAIIFTDSEDAMLEIPGINAERVRLYGRSFCALVKKYQKEFEDRKRDQEAPVDQHAQNIIDLLTDSEGEGENEDDYGSLDDADFDMCDDDESNDQSSTFFQENTSKRVEQFNARFAASQPADIRPQPQPKSKKRPSTKGKTPHYRPTAAGSGYDKAAGSRRYSGSGIGRKSRRSRDDGGSQPRRVAAARRGIDLGGIAMMPT